MRSSRLGVPITSKIFISWCVSARNSSPKRSFWSFSFRFEERGKHELPGKRGWTRRLGSSVCNNSAYGHTTRQSLLEYNLQTRCRFLHYSTVGGESAQELDTTESPHVESIDVQPMSCRPILLLELHHSSHHSVDPNQLWFLLPLGTDNSFDEPDRNQWSSAHIYCL